MPELHLPWLQCCILVPIIGAIWAHFTSDHAKNRRVGIIATALTLLCATGQWIDFISVGEFEAHDHWDVLNLVFHTDVFVIDELSAPLLPLAALTFLVVTLSTLRTKIKRFSFKWTLISEALLLATLSSQASWTLVIALALSTIPPWLELRSRGRCTRVYELHMGLFVVLLVSGYAIQRFGGYEDGQTALWPALLMGAAALLRSGIAPVHCWMTDLFEKATFGTAILYVTPLAGAYAIMRLVLPIAPTWALQTIAILSLVTAVYAAGMALVQTDARRFYCYIFLSHASLVLVGLELVTPIGLTGALCVWLSVGLALTGFGVTLRCVESRLGRVSLREYHGLYEQMPSLAAFFLLTGLASIGFPGTIGFIAMELLVDGAVQVFPLVGTMVVVAAALNGIAVMHAYFRVFTGKEVHTISLNARPSEITAVLLLTVLILAGGLYPQPGIASRHHAVIELGKHLQTNDSEITPDTQHSHPTPDTKSSSQLKD